MITVVIKSQKPVGLAGISVKDLFNYKDRLNRVTKACRLGRHFCLKDHFGLMMEFDEESQKPVGLAGISVSLATE